jgi:hypothetical protein
MIPNRLIASGCSFTAGYGLEDPATQAWPAVLGKLLGCDVVNLAEPGAGNTYILNKVLDFKSANPGENDIVIIGWSHWGRYDFCDPWGKITHLAHNSRMHHDFRDQLFRLFYNESYLYKKYLDTIILAQAWSRQETASYLMFDALSGMHSGEYMSDPVNRALAKQIDRKRFVGFGIKNMDNLTDADQRLSDGHPNAVAHEQMAKVLYQELINRNNKD